MIECRYNVVFSYCSAQDAICKHLTGRLVALKERYYIIFLGYITMKTFFYQLEYWPVGLRRPSWVVVVAMNPFQKSGLGLTIKQIKTALQVFTIWVLSLTQN